MLEGIVADVLVRVLGSYVDGLNRESIRVGVWRGDLELKNLRIRPDALAVLFESLGLDLPVTVTAGYIGVLRLEVPWKALRSSPVRIFMRDLNVVASPVTDGDQSALELRERRLKAARLANDEVLRDAKFTVRSEELVKCGLNRELGEGASETESTSQTTTATRVSRWGWRFTSRIVTRIVDNIQVDVKNVIVQYEDANSVRDCPYTATLGLDSLQACSTDRNWTREYVETQDSPVVYKVLELKGLVVNWKPGHSDDNLLSWILDQSSDQTTSDKLLLVHDARRHIIRPMDGELRIAITKSAALVSAIAGRDPALHHLRNTPRVQMDLCFPDVQLGLDDFQYHTLLSTIMYLSDIDRKVRPKSAKGRWLWALERLLPKFKERREAALRFNAEGLQQRREARVRYCEARNAVVSARRQGAAEPTAEAKIVEELESMFSFEDIIHFRDLADEGLYESLKKEKTSPMVKTGFWSYFSRGARQGSADKSRESGSASESNFLKRLGSRELLSSGTKAAEGTGEESDQKVPEVPKDQYLEGIDPAESGSANIFEDFSDDTTSSSSEYAVPNFRMGFRLGKGAIKLQEGGHTSPPTPMSSLEFRELRLGIETRPGAGFLLEALLGRFEVIDLQKEIKVMYPRAPWAGDQTETWDDVNDAESRDASGTADHPFDSTLSAVDEAPDGKNRSSHSVAAPLSTVSSQRETDSVVLDSYPHGLSEAIAQIRGEYGIQTSPLQGAKPKFRAQKSGLASGSSSGSLSGFSDGGLPASSYYNMEDLSVSYDTPLKYIAALRLSKEEATDGEWASGATRMAMDLAIGGMEVLVDGTQGAFISSVTFWHPREKMPSIMQFLTRAAAPRLASLRMDIQKAILERSVPLRMDLLICGPRFVVPGPSQEDLSLVLDMGTFAMETTTGAPQVVDSDALMAHSKERPSEMATPSNPLSVRYTDYNMTLTDLGLYVVSDEGRHAAERIIRPFSVHLLLQVLHSSSFVEAVTLAYGKVDIVKVNLQGKLPSLRTSVSHQAFRQLLGIARCWNHRSRRPMAKSGIEPNRASKTVSVSAEMEEVRQQKTASDLAHGRARLSPMKSPLISFAMSIELEDLQLELRDSSSRRIVTISSAATLLKMIKRPETIRFDYRVRSFTVLDGSRGATAPFRRLAYAGGESDDTRSTTGRTASRRPMESPSFISLSYFGDVVKHEQRLNVAIRSLNLVCVRESYFALADFFYLNKQKLTNRSHMSGDFVTSNEDVDLIDTDGVANGHSAEQVNPPENDYSDPFNALGMTTYGAARALREQAERGMEISKQAIANRGRLAVSADLEGLKLTLVTAEGAIACFDLTKSLVNLTQFSDGSVDARGELGGFGIQDLTSAFDVYSETVRYTRAEDPETSPSDLDGWKLRMPNGDSGDVVFEARMKNMRIVYLQRFIIILKKYFDVLRESLKPVLEMKGGIGEVFDAGFAEDFPVFPPSRGKVTVNLITENVDIVMPRHSQSPYEALRFFVPRSAVTNAEFPAPGYRVGLRVEATGVDTYVLYRLPAEGEGRALTEGGPEPSLQHIAPNAPFTDLTPFSQNISIVAKLDTWRRRKVPEVVLNADGLPVLKDGEEEREYDPAKWLPALRVRVSAPNGINARLCEAEYSILYFTFTENVIERPDIEFTDLVRGLKTPVLPARRPVQPIMFSSNKMPPNYQILFEVPRIDSVILSGPDPKNDKANLIQTQLRDLIGSFEYGVDYRMTIEVNANMHSLVDIRPGVPSFGKTLITPSDKGSEDKSSPCGVSELTRSVTFTWDRPFGFRSNVMVVASDLRIIVEPELFRDLGALTAPGFPFLKSSAPPPFLRFNGRLLIVTVSRPEVWLMANQFPGDGRSLVIRGDVIAKVQWAAVTGRKMVEVAANGIHVNLSNTGPKVSEEATPSVMVPTTLSGDSNEESSKPLETPMLYPSDISMKFDGSGYDPPGESESKPVKIAGSTLVVNAESFLVRLDVNDTPLILGVGSRMIRVHPSELSRRPVQPGRFDQWMIDKDEDGDAKLFLDLSLPHCRLMFTDENAGRYVPIMEARIKSAVLRSNVPWLTNAGFEFGLELFNEEKGWWEPGIEMFPIAIASSQGRSGSRAIDVRADRIIDLNVTPNTVSGAARVSKALKSAIVDLANRLRYEEAQADGVSVGSQDSVRTMGVGPPIPGTRRPSVAAFCVLNETGRSMVLWLPYDSKRRPLSGNGGEIEIDTPSEELLWTALGPEAVSSADPNQNRQVSLSCNISLSGYMSKTLSASQTGTWLVHLKPDSTELPSPAGGSQLNSAPLTMVWSVAMRDGVPLGCIRSVLRLVNHTRTVLEVNIGGFPKSSSVGTALRYTMSIPDNLEEESVLERESHVIIRAGESWAVPVHAVHRDIRIRPAIFHAPEADGSSDLDSRDPSPFRSRVYYTYKWSEPLSKVAALREIAEELSHPRKDERSSKVSSNNLPGPLLSCRAENGKGTFSLGIHPKIDPEELIRSRNDGSGWVDVHINAPIVVENLLPRSLYFKVALPGNSKKISSKQVLTEGLVEPMRVSHVHTIGSNIDAVAIAVGMDNAPEHDSRQEPAQGIQGKSVGEFMPALPSLQSISMGPWCCTPFTLRLHHEQGINTRNVKVYCDFWVRNRSDTALFFRDRGGSRDSKNVASPKVLLRARPPGTKADKFLCFSGKWLSLQRADVVEDAWVDVGTEVPEIDKPVHIRFERLSLLLDVRPAKGRFHRTLVVTVRNSIWLENRTGAVLQWCQPAALNPHGIALSSRVHRVSSGAFSSLHWDFSNRKRAICLRRSNEDGTSDWIWSRPVSVEGVEGEFPAKMYRPKRHEQYIARVVISRLGNGVLGVVVLREDRNTPPYRIVNRCSVRSIAFRQSGVNETHPWLVRPGKSTRYSWDDPLAPVKKRSLVVEVIEKNSDVETQKMGADESASDRAGRDDPSESRSNTRSFGMKREKEIRYPKFDLNIDIITNRADFPHPGRFDPDLHISVQVDGPTKVVTFSDCTETAPKEQSDNQLNDNRALRTTVATTADHGSSIARNLDVALFINSLGVSFVESRPTELAYLSVTGILFRLDRFEGQQMIRCEVQDLQLDNQLVRCTWPVVLWSPPPPESNTSEASSSQGVRRNIPKPLIQLTIDGPFPSIQQGIGNFRGIFAAVQELRVAADEDFVLRVWLFVTSLIEAAGGSAKDKTESLTGRDGLENGLPLLSSESAYRYGNSENEDKDDPPLKLLYVQQLELCPLKLTVSFTSSRTSTAAEHIGGFRYLMRTLVAVLGNVENAEFRFNALELRHVFDSVSHFRSLIAEYYISQGSNQKMVLLASNSLIGNPSALFDSIAIGTRDFFVEPANARSSADFIAGIGRGSSSLLTNTVGGLVGSIGAIPRAVAHGLETAVGDRDYLAERDSIRGGRARMVSSPAQGLLTGALSFGHGIASAAAGLIRDPLQGAAEEGASGFIKGLGKGFIGGVLKPITGALDLIAEPAAGFRSMMVSDINKHAAEPCRPPRAFWGAYGNQMISYDLQAALGQAILEAILNSDSDALEERLISWNHLIQVHQNAESIQVATFLWAVLRRSTRSSNFQSKYLLDAQGHPQTAEKMRVGLITTKRLIISSLDGHVLWEYPLVDVVDTHVSREAKDYLMVGVRPIGYSSKAPIAPHWKKIHCGSMRARDDLNSALRKALQDLRTDSENVADSSSKRPPRTSLERSQPSPDVDKSVELVDMAALATIDTEGDSFEMKSLHQDASVDGKRGVFSEQNMPGRDPMEDGWHISDHLRRKASHVDLTTELESAMSGASVRRRIGTYRSVRIFVVNATGNRLMGTQTTLVGGQWARAPPNCIHPRCVVILEAGCSGSRVDDLYGFLTFVVAPEETDDRNQMYAIRFVNPTLAANAFVVHSPEGFVGVFKGGEKGDHVQTVLTLRYVTEDDRKVNAEGAACRRSKGKAEPLLFGRSQVPPFLPPINYSPPKTSRSKSEEKNPDDPELIANLSSLGFSEQEAAEALRASEADVSLAYAELIRRESNS